MKTLSGYVLLYDAVCPLCKMYTKTFVQCGLLDENGRSAYQEPEASVACFIDPQRAVNEIALVNRATGEVVYGVKSLLKILGNAWPVFRQLFQWQPFILLVTYLYRFISYNRRVFVPAAARKDSGPALHRGYRAAWLLLSWAAVAMLVQSYALNMFPVVEPGNAAREWIICGGQLILQGTLAAIWAKPKWWDYLGNMMVVSFLGAMALIPLQIAFKALQLSAIWYVAGFMLVAALMLLEHARRVKLLELPVALTYSWVIYRLFLLLLIELNWL